MATEPTPKNSGQENHLSLRFRMTIIVVIVSLAPMVLVSAIFLTQFNSFSHEMVHAHLGELVQKHRQNIDFFLRDKLNDIGHFSKSFSVEQLKDEAFLKQRLRGLQEAYNFVFVDLGVVDHTGQQVSYAGPFELHKANYANSEWFQKAIQSQSYISDVFLGLRGHPHFIVAVKQQWGGSEWILRATIDFFAFNTLVENLSVGKTGTAFILNREGQYQTRPPKEEPQLTRQQYLNLFKKGEDALQRYLGQFKRGHEEPAARQRLEDLGLSLGSLEKPPEGYTGIHVDRYSVGYIQQGLTFSVEKINAENKKFIIVAAFLKDNEWLLIFQQEYEDAFEKFNRTQNIVGVISFLGALGIIIVALIVSGQMAKRIAKLDMEKEMMNQQVIETGKLASVGELAAGIAHEINNPVAIMVEEAGWAQDLLEEGIEKTENLPEFKRALKQIQTQGRRCKEITHKLLSFARKTDSRVQTVQLNELITEVVDLLSQKSRYANVEVVTDLQADLPPIEASVTEMQQVLMNLLHNAVDAMEKHGGRIDITSRFDADGDAMRLSIADNGPGIPASNLARLFDPFFTTKPVGKGSGLGLSICYGIIHKMGGRIEVESQVGKGATFHIALPVHGHTVKSQGG